MPIANSSDAHLVTESTDAELRATAAESGRQIRGVLDELADPDSEMTAHPGTRTRLEGAVAALESLAGYRDVADGSGSTSTDSSAR